jgi:hypothetical protein
MAPKAFTMPPHNRVWIQDVKHGLPVINVVCEGDPE